MIGKFLNCKTDTAVIFPDIFKKKLINFTKRKNMKNYAKMGNRAGRPGIGPHQVFDIENS